MKFVNLTKHRISLSPIDGIDISVRPSGVVARVSVEQTQSHTIPSRYSPGDDEIDIPVRKNTYGEITGLPAPADDTIYIVSAMVLAGTDRPDVYGLDTGPTAIRDDRGNIVAVRALVQ